MFLILGDKNDPWGRLLESRFKRRGYECKLVSNPLVSPNRFTWQLDNAGSKSWLNLPRTRIDDNAISGVFVRSSGWLDRKGWDQEDFGYMQSELHAALLAWLWSLDCRVVNRFVSSVWYYPHKPLLMWYPILHKCGLSTPESLLTNIEEEAKDFAKTSDICSQSSVIYGPLTTETKYLIADERDWCGIATLQRCGPVNLTFPHGPVQLACLVGRDVIWNTISGADTAEIELAMVRFSQVTGLDFFEMAFTSSSEGSQVIAVDPIPRFEHFCKKAREEIINNIVDLLASPRELCSVGNKFGEFV